MKKKYLIIRNTFFNNYLQSFDIKTVEGMIANLNDEQKTTMNQQVNHAIASLKLFLGQDNEKIIKEI